MRSVPAPDKPQAARSLPRVLACLNARTNHRNPVPCSVKELVEAATHLDPTIGSLIGEKRFPPGTTIEVFGTMDEDDDYGRSWLQWDYAGRGESE